MKQRAGGGLFECTDIQIREIIDIDHRPAVLTSSDITRGPVLSRGLYQIGGDSATAAVDQAWPDHDCANALLGAVQHHALHGWTPGDECKRLQRSAFVRGRITGIA